eukprot:GSChrysophyteH1.ASY1.ANO1.1590.1 assembled CDS
MDVRTLANNAVEAVVNTAALKKTARETVAYRYAKVSESRRLAKLATWIVDALNEYDPDLASYFEKHSHWLLALAGLLISSTFVILVTNFITERRSSWAKMRLNSKLEDAMAEVRELTIKLNKIKEEENKEKIADARKKGKEVRIWMDGAFDMMHYGHMNAFRQVNKGQPVCNDDERLQCVAGCKFVDEVVTDVPYVMSPEYVKHIIEKYDLDYIVHGDDPCLTPDGKDVYAAAKAMDKYRSIPRTEGVSTTDIVGRMLLNTKAHHNTKDGDGKEGNDDSSLHRILTNRRSNFLTTSHILRQFSMGVQAPAKTDRVVYIAGDWDMFHAGHISAISEAKKLGDYLIVGIHADSIVNARYGANLPIMNLQERVLSVLGCKNVDDVLIDAPYKITNDMISSLNIATVVKSDVDLLDHNSGSLGHKDPYEIPRKENILREVSTPSKFKKLTVLDIVDRIKDQRERFEKKFAKKKQAEDEYYKNRYSKK